MGEFTPSSFDATQGLNVGSFNSQDEFVGYGTAFNNPDRFVLQMKERIHLINPSAAPFLSWASMVRKQTVGGVNFSWMEDELFTHRDIRAKLKFDYSETVWTLQLQDAGDWQAFEAAAAADVWHDEKPLVHMLIKAVAGTPSETVALVINQAALYLGPTTRAYTGTGSGTTLINEMVICESTTIGGDNGEVGVVTKGDGAGTAAVSGDYGYGKVFTPGDWDDDGSADFSTDVYVQVITPNEYLGGFAQGSGLPNETRKRSRTLQNFTQIFKTNFTIADTLLKADLYGPSELARLRLRKAIQHKTDIERAILFQGGGTLHTDWGQIPVTGATNPLTRFKGLGVGAAQASPGFIASKNGEWNTDFQFASATADISAINALCAAVFDDTVDAPSSTKVVFASQKWMLALSNMATNESTAKWSFGDWDRGAESMGITVKTLHSPVGSLRFVPMPYFRGLYEDYAMVIDFANIEIRPFTGRDTRLIADAGGRDIDGQLDYYITELGFECRHEGTHALLKLV